MQVLRLWAVLALLGVSCHTNAPLDDWQTLATCSKQVGAIHYYFPAATPIALRQRAIAKCEQAIAANLPLLHATTIDDTIRIEFVGSRADMKNRTTVAVAGLTLPEVKTVLCTIDQQVEQSSPIQHELMHLMAVLRWGMPAADNQWLNEGLATYAAGKEGTCTPYSFAEMYQYFLSNGKIIPIESLRYHFYDHFDMISYTQSAYLVQQLLQQYSIRQFEQLWRAGIDQFEPIYGISFAQFEQQLRNQLAQQHPQAMQLDWDKFKRGCRH